MSWPQRLARRWRAPRFAGRVDGVVEGKLAGWAVDRRAAGRPAAIAIESGGETIVVAADVYRADVQLGVGGDGYCGFAVSAARLARGGPCRVRFEGEGVELDGSPLDPWAEPPPAAAFVEADYAFRLDAWRRNGALTGYAVDRARPQSRRRIALRGRGSIIAEAPATLYRPEAEAYAGDGLHGFFLPAVAAEAPLEIVDVEAGCALARLAKDGGVARWTDRHGR